MEKDNIITALAGRLTVGALPGELREFGQAEAIAAAQFVATTAARRAQIGRAHV